MAGERWERTTLGEIADKSGYGLVDGPFGSNLPAAIYTHDGVPVIRGSNLSFGTVRFDDSEFVFISEEIAQRLRRSLCYAGDIVFTKKGTLGQTGFVPQLSHYRQFLLSSNQMKLTVDRKVADPLFVYYYVSSPEAREKIIRDAEMTGVPKTNTAYLRSFPIHLPPLDQQRAIAHILGTLDDKIELNRRMNETLEGMARTIFKSWFVDTAQNGESGKVSDLLTLSRETTNPVESPTEIFDHYSIPAFDEGLLPKPDAGENIQSNKFIVPVDCVLLSKLNPRIPRVWFPSVSKNRRSVCSTEFLVATPKPGGSREYIYGLFNSSSFLGVFTTLITGTSGSHQRVKPEYLLEMYTEVPPKERVEKYTTLVKPLHDRVALNMRESRTLAALRNTLLPKLISGELRVKGAERIIEERV